MADLPTTNDRSSANQNRLMPADPDKDTRDRVGHFISWLDNIDPHQAWLQLDMAAYRDYLLSQGLQSSTVRTHLSTIRGRYQALLNDNAVRTELYVQLPAGASPADRKAFVDELLTRVENSLKPGTSRVTVITKQDRADSEHLRLTADQADILINRPDVTTLVGLRDATIIAFMLCTGLREFELCALQIDDLRQQLNGVLAVRVRSGKGAKARLVPYGGQEWVIDFIGAWTQAAGITEGYIFRGFYKARIGTQPRVRPSALTVRAIQYILADYPIYIDGHSRQVTPHDLRRTFARRCYESGMDPERIRQNLGHANIKTTQLYIGDLTAEHRKPPALYRQPNIPKLPSGDVVATVPE